MSEMFVENMNSVEMEVEEETPAVMEDPTTERIIKAVSPTVEMERVTGGLKITVHDVNGTQENNVFDGQDGEQGQQGPQGEQGPAGQDGADGADGQDGEDGTNAYVYIRYSANQPTQDSDMKTTPDAWMGIYSGDASTAPTAYTSYTWYKIKGETGQGGVQYASELPMSSSDSTKTDVAVNGKVAIQQNVADAGKALGIGNDGRVVPVPFSGNDFTGATASTDGVHGYVPAPLTGEQGKVLMGDGTWSADIPTRLAAVENVYTDSDVTIASTDWTLSSGSYTYTWTSTLVTAACGVEVFLRDGAESAGIEDFNFGKVTGGVQFTTDEQPTGSLPVTIRIINTKSDAILALEADQVASEAISGCDDVEAALTNLDGRVTTLNSKITNLNSKITNLNSKTTILNWGTYGSGDHTIATDIELGKTYKIALGTNGRFVVYFTPSGFGTDEQVAVVTGSDVTLISFKNKNTLNVNGATAVRTIARLNNIVL